jgi:histidinol-phosphate aminotransferase
LDSEWVEGYVRSVVEARTYLVGELRRLGIRQFPTDGNFVLINVGDSAQQLVAHMRENEILIRDRSHEIPGCVRVTIGTIEQMTRFISELENM